MTVNTISMRLIVLPLSIINIAICVDESPFSVGFVVFPPAFVHRPIRPYLSSFTLPNILSLNPIKREKRWVKMSGYHHQQKLWIPSQIKHFIWYDINLGVSVGISTSYSYCPTLTLFRPTPTPSPANTQNWKNWKKGWGDWWVGAGEGDIIIEYLPLSVVFGMVF